MCPKPVSSLLLWPAAALVGWSLAGCGPASKPAAPAMPAAHAEHDHDEGHDHDAEAGHGDHAHAETLADGVVALREAARNLAEKLAGDAQDAADAAVHAAGHAVEDLQAMLTTQEGLVAEAKEAGTKALDDLFEAFDKVDQAMHGEAEDVKAKAAAVHAEVKDTIDRALKALEERFGKEDH